MVTIEPMRPGEGERRAAMLGQAFSTAPRPYDPDAPALPPERVLTAYDGDRAVGTLSIIPFTQWWGGRPVPMGGVSGVFVEPHMRGTGLAKRLLHEAFDAMRGFGDLVSGLYPTTASLYASVGYAPVGRHRVTELPISAFSRYRMAEGLTVRPLEPGDMATFAGVEALMCAGHQGWIQSSDLQHQWLGYAWAAGKPWAPRYGYAVDRGGDTVAAALWSHVEGGSRNYNLDVKAVAAVDREAWHALFALLATHGTAVDTVKLALPDSLIDVLVRTDWWSQGFAATYMMRLLDLPGAVGAWGLPDGRAARLELEVVDHDIDANAGNWVIEVADGRMSAERGGAGKVKIGTPALGAMMAGYLDTAGLTAAGMVHGEVGDIAGLDVFAAGSVGPQTFF